MNLESEDGKRLLLTLAGGYIVIVHYIIIQPFNMFENFYNKKLYF